MELPATEEYESKTKYSQLAKSEQALAQPSRFGPSSTFNSGPMDPIYDKPQVASAGGRAGRVQVLVAAEELVDAGELVDVVEVGVAVELTSAGRTKQRATGIRGFLNAIFIILK
jgi:hypothetical protein